MWSDALTENFAAEANTVDRKVSKQSSDSIMSWLKHLRKAELKQAQNEAVNQRPDKAAAHPLQTQRYTCPHFLDRARSFQQDLGLIG